MENKEKLASVASEELTGEEFEDLLRVGVDAAEKERGGTYIQKDHSVVRATILQEGIEILSIGEALQKYSWLEQYWWKAVSPGEDDPRTISGEEKGYYIRVLPGVKSIFPVQACLYIASEGLVQNVHNIVIVEEGAELDVITGCASGRHVVSGMHVGISEFYIKKNAKLNFTMIHNWAEKVAVQPRTGTVVEEGGVFLSNYVCMHPVDKLEMYPTTYLIGRGSTARYHTILIGHPNSRMDVGSRVVLRGEDSRAEILARSITMGGYIVNRGHLVGEAPGVKGHLECRGLMLAPEGVIHAIPELEARAEGVDLSHEAAVGKIAQEEIEYLMARGLSEDEATATIVRGFLNVKVMGLPAELEAEIERAIGLSDESSM
ncbi:MAG: FeS assembly protein SufB [Thermoanaerobacterales bacterium 50_218]|nr:MAG: FeS assembly protein SufB [Thermoanaerobacterales bacterium 50_218]HAA90066.1 hypothetical protein [Peptococcaceae bacterium]